jgi:hypothetical protein
MHFSILSLHDIMQANMSIKKVEKKNDYILLILPFDYQMFSQIMNVLSQND